MKYLRNLSLAFSSGITGSIALLIAATIIRVIPSRMEDMKANIYRLLIWGGIWALLLALPILQKRWFIRGSILSITVILFNFIVLMPLSGAGFFAVHAGWTTFWSNIGFNYLWGIVAALWYSKTK
jgi:hypothetical protein